MNGWALVTSDKILKYKSSLSSARWCPQNHDRGPFIRPTTITCELIQQVRRTTSRPLAWDATWKMDAGHPFLRVFRGRHREVDYGGGRRVKNITDSRHSSAGTAESDKMEIGEEEGRAGICKGP
jgi:hypothetical protein